MFTRRRLIGSAVGAGLAVGFGREGLTQATPTSANPGAALSTGFDYPQVVARFTPDGYDLSEPVPAGRVVVTMSDLPPDMMTLFSPFRLAPGDTIEDFIAETVPTQFSGPAGMPVHERATWPGGEYGFPDQLPPGAGVQGAAKPGIVLTLEPGTWYSLDALRPELPPQPFEVVGEAPSYDAEPTADATIEMADFRYILPESFEPGEQVWKIANTGEQWHDIHILAVPEGPSDDEVLAAIERQALDPEASPAPGEIDVNNEVFPVFGICGLSGGQAAWKTVTIEAGRYLITTWAGDSTTGTPQLTLGMMAIFTVGGA
jgi:hypothetical protein